jgi:hypothetical protein
MFESEAACHAAVLEGGPVLIWYHKNITDQEAEWIASALVNPVVCHSGYLYSV